jgi:hypothetical protein
MQQHIDKHIDEQVALARIRWHALRELWIHRSYWRLGEPRQIMRDLRDQQLVECMPFILLVAALAGGLIFILIPSVLPEQASTLTSAIWPIWVATAAPMVCAQTMVLLVAPPLAMELAHKHASGYFSTINTAYGAPAGLPCISWIVALSAVCVVASFVLVVFSLVIGLGFALMFAVGDVRATLDAVLLSAPPIKWIRSGIAAAILGAIAGLSVVLYAWPGTQAADNAATNAAGAHRMSLRVMLVCSISVALSGSAINWIASLFDRSY